MCLFLSRANCIATHNEYETLLPCLNNLVLFAKSLQIKRFDNYKADQ